MTNPISPTAEGPLPTTHLTVHHLRIARPGPPKVLLLGGSNFDLRLKRSFLDSDLAQQCDLATYEPRGIGRTEQPDGPWTMRDYAQDALCVLDTLGWDKAVIVGESFGGMTALHLAHLAPHRVNGLVIASATAGGPVHASYDISEFVPLPIETAAEAALCLQDTRNRQLQKDDPDGFSKVLHARIALETAFRDPSITSGGYVRLLEARRGHDCNAILPDITTPTTVIAGRFDRQARPDAQQALADGLANAKFHMFDAGHGVLFSEPEASQTAMAAIRDTAQSVETAESR